MNILEIIGGILILAFWWVVIWIVTYFIGTFSNGVRGDDISVNNATTVATLMIGGLLVWIVWSGISQKKREKRHALYKKKQELETAEGLKRVHAEKVQAEKLAKEEKLEQEKLTLLEGISHVTKRAESILVFYKENNKIPNTNSPERDWMDYKGTHTPLLSNWEEKRILFPHIPTPTGMRDGPDPKDNLHSDHCYNIQYKFREELQNLQVPTIKDAIELRILHEILDDIETNKKDDLITKNKEQLLFNKRVAKEEREINTPIKEQLSRTENFLANDLNTITFDKYANFKNDNPTEEERSHLHATWHRRVDTLSEKEKLSFVILEFLKCKKIISYDDYQYIYGCIVFNEGDAKLKMHDSDGYRQSFYEQNHGLVPDKPWDMVNRVFKIYEQIQSENPALLGNYLSKYISKGASWFKETDFVNSNNIKSVASPYSLFLGTLKNTAKKVYFDSDESLITIAPPGSGKTQCNVLANLVEYEAPAIILDVKGDCYKSTAKHRERYGKVLRFSPLDVQNSSHYNPLDFMSEKPLEIWQDAQKISKLIIVADKNNDHWQKRATDILTAIIAYVKMDDDIKTMTRVCDWASASTDEYDMLVASLTMSEVNGMRRAGNSLQSMLKNNPKQFEGVLDTLRGYLGAWEGDNVSAITNKSDWQINDFMQGDNSPSLYLVIPPAEIETYAPVLRVIIGQHLSHFLSDHDNVAEKPILFMLDEMPRLGNFDLIPQAQDTGRSYNIKLWMFAQYVGQLRNAYGKDIADGLIGAAGARIYMNPSEDFAGQLSKQLGECDDVLLGKKIPLASAIELTGREFADDIIVSSKGESPIRLNKVFFGTMGYSTEPEVEHVSIEEDPTSETVETSLEDA